MTGPELYEYHQSFRDFSGTDRDRYAQTLQTALVLFGDKVFAMLERANKESKRIELIEDDSLEGEPSGMKLI